MTVLSFLSLTDKSLFQAKQTPSKKAPAQNGKSSKPNTPAKKQVTISFHWLAFCSTLHSGLAVYLTPPKNNESAQSFLLSTDFY